MFAQILALCFILKLENNLENLILATKHLV